MIESSEVEKAAEALRKRSTQARRSAWLSVVLIVVTVFSMITFFYIGDLVRVSYAYPLERAQSGGAYAPDKIDKDIRMKELEVELKKSELERSALESARLTTTITESVAKVGAVLIAIYLLQILLSLTRYHFKLADHLEMSSNAIALSGNDEEKMKKMMDILAINHIDFGKSPSTPIEKIVEAVKDVVSKIPNK